MVKDLDRGILVTLTLGGNSNSTTGDFSHGVLGYLVEKGKIVRPVSEMNIAGNHLEFWKRLVEVGRDPYPYSSYLIPTLRFDDVNFAGA
jgi:PmbA protein